jgi:alkaline phosphatase D
LTEGREAGKGDNEKFAFLTFAIFFRTVSRIALLEIHIPRGLALVIRTSCRAIGSVLLSLVAAFAGAEEKPLSRIDFGSCAHQDKPQPIWDAIVADKPELFLLIGDNIYGDSEDMAVLRAKYAKLGAQPGFKKLRASCPLLATWDDHDYGKNDAGADFPKRAESQKLFSEFFEVPEDSPIRKRAGVYGARIFGPEGKRVQVILLDTRYFRTPLREWTKKERPKGRGPYRQHDLENGGKDATVLGEAQWMWLAEQFRQPADIRIVASSIQVIAWEHGWEMWGNFPTERKRLFDLIASTKASGVILISGDRHLAELSRIEAKESGVGYRLWDATSSSLNQPGSPENDNEPNRYRAGGNYRPVNFGSIGIDWTQEDPAITLAIHGENGAKVREQKLRLSELQAE